MDTIPEFPHIGRHSGGSLPDGVELDCRHFGGTHALAFKVVSCNDVKFPIVKVPIIKGLIKPNANNFAQVIEARYVAVFDVLNKPPRGELSSLPEENDTLCG